MNKTHRSWECRWLCRFTWFLWSKRQYSSTQESKDCTPENYMIESLIMAFWAKPWTLMNGGNDILMGPHIEKGLYYFIVLKTRVTIMASVLRINTFFKLPIRLSEIPQGQTRWQGTLERRALNWCRKELYSKLALNSHMDLTMIQEKGL